MFILNKSNQATIRRRCIVDMESDGVEDKFHDFNKKNIVHIIYFI